MSVQDEEDPPVRGVHEAFAELDELGRDQGADDDREPQCSLGGDREDHIHAGRAHNRGLADRGPGGVPA